MSHNVIFRPGAMYARTTEETGQNGPWTLLRGPLFVALALACSISILTRGYVAPGLVLSGCITWSFVPLGEIAGLAATWRARRRNLCFPQAIDLYFAGHGPWLLWLIAFAVFWWFAGIQLGRIFLYWLLSAIPVAVWSGYIDYQFFRHVLRVKHPGRCLILQRIVAWTIFIFVFGGVSFWPGLIEEIGQL